MRRARSTSVACATVLAPSTNADVLTSLKETATATETSLTSVAFVAVTASQKAIATATETNSTPSENVAGNRVTADAVCDADGICDDVDPCV